MVAEQNKPVQLPGILGRGENYINDKVIQPFRQGLDTIGNGLEKYANDNSNLTPLTRGLVGGLGALTKAAPVGNNIRETVGNALVMPELGAEESTLGRLGEARPERDAVDIMSGHAAQIPKETWIKKAGAEYKGSMPHPKGGVLHFFNDPQTGSTLALHGNSIRSEHDVLEHMRNSRTKFSK